VEVMKAWLLLASLAFAEGASLREKPTLSGHASPLIVARLRGGAPVQEGVRLAVERRSESVVARAVRLLFTALGEHRTIVLWAIWIFGGAAWAMWAEGWDPITALYFAVGGLATGGLQAPSLTSDGTLKDGSAVFVALYCLSGIPIFAMALGQFANVFVQRLLAARERRAIDRPISEDEYEFAQQLFNADGAVDLSEYMALELMRLGKVDMGMLQLITAKFKRMDADRNGKLTVKEVLKGMKEEGASS